MYNTTQAVSYFREHLPLQTQHIVINIFFPVVKLMKLIIALAFLSLFKTRQTQGSFIVIIRPGLPHQKEFESFRCYSESSVGFFKANVNSLSLRHSNILVPGSALSVIFG